MSYVPSTHKPECASYAAGPFAPCTCASVCGDTSDESGTCKGLARSPQAPLVEVVLVPRAVPLPARPGTPE